MQTFNTYHKGFVALLSVILMSAILLGLVATANTAGFFSRFAELDQAYKQSSYALAEACANKALLTLAEQYSYAPVNQQLTVGDYSCTMVSISTLAVAPDHATVIIVTHAAYKNTFTTLAVTARVYNPAVASATIEPAITITNWQETE